MTSRMNFEIKGQEMMAVWGKMPKSLVLNYCVVTSHAARQVEHSSSSLDLTDWPSLQ